jgi:hypothetical protein
VLVEQLRGKTTEWMRVQREIRVQRSRGEQEEHQIKMEWNTSRTT